MNQKGFTLYELVILMGILASLALSGVLLYAGWHFVSKFW